MNYDQEYLSRACYLLDEKRFDELDAIATLKYHENRLRSLLQLTKINVKCGIFDDLFMKLFILENDKWDATSITSSLYFLILSYIFINI